MPRTPNAMTAQVGKRRFHNARDPESIPKAGTLFFFWGTLSQRLLVGSLPLPRHFPAHLLAQTSPTLPFVEGSFLLISPTDRRKLEQLCCCYSVGKTPSILLLHMRWWGDKTWVLEPPRKNLSGPLHAKPPSHKVDQHRFLQKQLWLILAWPTMLPQIQAHRLCQWSIFFNIHHYWQFVKIYWHWKRRNVRQNVRQIWKKNIWEKIFPAHISP